MSGDYTRLTWNPKNNYTAVWPQQGRVTIDADTIEREQISDRRWRSESMDLVGKCVVPLNTPQGFEIHADSAGELTIGVGRAYVDGIQVENHGVSPMTFDRHLGELRGTQPVPYRDQPYYPLNLPPDISPEKDRTDLVYVHIWEREINAIQDPHIREIALGGPDTAMRLQTVWQVKVLQGVDAAHCADDIAEWNALVAPSTGRLTSSVVAPPPSDKPCIIDPSGGYSGLENRLYRVEVHADGTLGGTGDIPSFKWSRCNASIVQGVEEVCGNFVRLTDLGHDDVQRFKAGDWVEILDERTQLSGKPGQMARFVKVTNAAKRIIELDSMPTGFDPTDPLRRTRIRRWDQRSNVNAAGLVDISSGPIELEDGIQVEFTDGKYRVGDYWLIPARTANGSIEELVAAPPRGINNHYCRLALITWADSNVDPDVTDCRKFWPPKPCCCVTVLPGEDVQRIIDSVIDSGGGCICLAKGLHRVPAPLQIHGARNLTIHGVGPATILRLDGDQGGSGMEMDDCVRLALEEMTIIGSEQGAVIDVNSGPNEDIRMSNLSIFNLCKDQNGPLAFRSAIRLREALNMSIRDCQLFAVVGLVTRPNADLPAINSDNGVPVVESLKPIVGLELHNVTVRFLAHGIWSLLAQDWILETSDFAALMRKQWDDLMDAAPADPESESQHRVFLERSLPLSSQQEGLGEKESIFLTGWRWTDCRISHCRMQSDQGVEIWWWKNGDLEDSSLYCNESGIYSAWMHGARWSNNRIICRDGAAMQVTGCFRGRVAGNVIRARHGLINVPCSKACERLPRLIRDITTVYGASGATAEASALWVLVEDFADETGLRELVDAIQALGSSADGFQLPILLWATAYLYEVLSGIEECKCIAPVIDLRLESNDFACDHESPETAAVCVRIQDFLPMGGMSISDNRLHTTTGQALLIETATHFNNPHLIIAMWRTLMESIGESLESALAIVEESDNLPDGVPRLLQALSTLVSRFQRSAETFLDADYHIASNSIRSRLTGIESNLYDLVVRENHISMQQQKLINDQRESIHKALTVDTNTAPLGEAYRDGNAMLMFSAGDTLTNDSTLFTNSNARESTAEAIMNAGTGLNDPEVTDAAFEVGAAIAAADLSAFRIALAKFILQLSQQANHYGILIRGAGCQITENHVLVSPDIDKSTWSRGGIRLWADPPILDAHLSINRFILGDSLNILLGVTETRIDSNEIIGGAGHGIDIHDVVDWSTDFKGNTATGSYLCDLRVTGNQIRDMGGAGVAIDDTVMALGVEIVGNQIIDCSRHSEVADWTRFKGGIVIRQAAYCRLLNNQITRVGGAAFAYPVYGIDLEAIMGLTIEGNRLIENGGSEGGEDNGAIVLADIYGEVAIVNNEILSNRGMGILWANTGDMASVALPSVLLTEALSSQPTSLGFAQVSTGSGALVHGNRILADATGTNVAFLQITNINRLNVSNNNMSATTPLDPRAKLDSISRLCMSANLITGVDFSATTTVQNCGTGLVSGNVTSPFGIVIMNSANVVRGLNSP